ncbi:MAG: GlsB/YeaQ/YmgE family stress response membrane protein [Thermoleophilaceae bacterium]
MIGFIVFGLIIGLLARFLLPGKQKIGLLWTLLLGLIGSVIGGTIANALAAGSIFELNFIGVIAAVVTSVVLLAVAERSGLLASGRDDSERLGRGRA